MHDQPNHTRHMIVRAAKPDRALCIEATLRSRHDGRIQLMPDKLACVHKIQRLL